MIAQVLNAPKKSPKSFITNEVTLVFVDSLCASITYTLKAVSISGFGIKNFIKLAIQLKHLLINPGNLNEIKTRIFLTHERSCDFFSSKKQWF